MANCPHCGYRLGGEYKFCPECGQRLAPEKKIDLAFANSSANLVTRASGTGILLYQVKDKSLTSIVIPDRVTAIADCTFDGCSNLKSIIIPDSVTYIGNRAFNDCISLESMIIPKGVTEIRFDTFRNCKSMRSIIIHSGVTTISTWAFDECWKLTIYCEAKSKPAGFREGWNWICPVVWGYKRR